MDYNDKKNHISSLEERINKLKQQRNSNSSPVNNNKKKNKNGKMVNEFATFRKNRKEKPEETKIGSIILEKFNILKGRIRRTKLSSTVSTILLLVLLFFIGISLAGAVSMLISFRLYINKGTKTATPNVIGLKTVDGILQAQEYGFPIELETRVTQNKAEEGNILSQNPAGGTLLKIHKKIVLITGILEQDYIIKDYTNKNIDKVKNLIESQKEPIQIGNISYIENSKLEAGTIIQQDPPEKTRLKSAEKISFLVSKKPKEKQLIMGNFVGSYFSNAIKALAEKDIPFIFKETNEYKDGKVISQYPAQNSKITFADIVELTITMIKDTPEKSFGLVSLDLPTLNTKAELKTEIRHQNGNLIEEYFKINYMGRKISFPYFIDKGLKISVTYNNKKVYEKVVE